MNQRIAVLIDGENISHRYFTRIYEKLKKLGTPVLTRIYGDWSRRNMVGWIPIVSVYPIKPVHQFQRGKNTIDFHLAMDAVDLFHRQPEINNFCIVSSDSDFSALCLWLRDEGKSVIGCGERKSSKDYMGCFNEFIIIDDLAVDVPVKKHIASRNNERGTKWTQHVFNRGEVSSLRGGVR
jgi:uncharacterized LabA/DUF88 family protein